MTDFSKCCGGNGMKPERHCQDCGQTWGRTKKELVELIERERTEFRVLQQNAATESERAAILRSMFEKSLRECGDLKSEIRTVTDHSDKWNRLLTSEQVAHKSTRERLAKELGQIAVESALREDSDKRREHWQRIAVEAIRSRGEAVVVAWPVAKPVERGPHAPVGPRGDFSCDCNGVAGTCHNPTRHGVLTCAGKCPNGQPQCKDCFLPF